MQCKWCFPLFCKGRRFAAALSVTSSGGAALSVTSSGGAALSVTSSGGAALSVTSSGGAAFECSCFVGDSHLYFVVPVAGLSNVCEKNC